VPQDPYTKDKWNLNNFPKLEGTHASMLRYIEDNIPGVIVPWLYVSASCCLLQPGGPGAARRGARSPLPLCLCTTHSGWGSS
jgi:hypothetical protein